MTALAFYGLTHAKAKFCNVNQMTGFYMKCSFITTPKIKISFKDLFSKCD